MQPAASEQEAAAAAEEEQQQQKEELSWFAEEHTHTHAQTDKYKPANESP